MLDTVDEGVYSAPHVILTMRITSSKLIALLLISICVTAIIYILMKHTSAESISVHAQQLPIEPGSIDDLVQNATARGEVFVSVPIEVMHEDVEGFDDARDHYSIVVAQALSKQSFAVSAYDIETWFKFAITETLSTKQPHVCVSGECSLPATLPAPGQSELWLSKAGGAIVRNGVTVSQPWNDFPDFTIGQKYLLFIDLNQSTRVGVPAIGPVGVFMVDDSGTIASVFDEETSLKSEIASRFGNSLGQIRNTINPTPVTTCSSAQRQTCLDNGGNWNSDTCYCKPVVNLCVQKPWLCP